ncbi:hypothetical protein KXV85_004037, partial [Aspergillus fumigatus]
SYRLPFLSIHASPPRSNQPDLAKQPLAAGHILPVPASRLRAPVRSGSGLFRRGSLVRVRPLFATGEPRTALSDVLLRRRGRGYGQFRSRPPR